MAKSFKAEFKIDVPAKLNEELEKELTRQLAVIFEKIPTDKPRTKPEK